MSTDQTLPKDALAAAELLAALALKDQDETICRYPTCRTLRQEATGTGRPSAYCDNPDHTAVSNHRARVVLKAIASSVAQETPIKREQPTGVIPIESLRSSVLQAMTQLQGNLERYMTTLVEIADPDISAAQIQAILDRADARIADAQQTISAERSLRLAAESAGVVARQEAQAEREAAELAIEHMEEAEARTQRVQVETEQQIVAVQAERDETVNLVRVEAQHQIEDAFYQAKEAVATAEAATATAQEEARRANARAHDAEVDARTRIATAERLVSEANATLERADEDRTEAAAVLERERGEVDRARKELTEVTTNAREQTVADHDEIKRLREELATTRIRTDRLAELNDELRTQLIERQNPTQQ